MISRLCRCLFKETMFTFHFSDAMLLHT